MESDESHVDVERDSPDLGLQGMDLLVFDNSVIAEIRQKLGEEVIVSLQNEQVVWNVVDESHVDVERDLPDLDLQGMDLLVFDNSVIAKIFLQLTFSNWKDTLDLMNTAIGEKTPKIQNHRDFICSMNQSFLSALDFSLVLQSME
jgi:hypothetical protein